MWCDVDDVDYVFSHGDVDGPNDVDGDDVVADGDGDDVVSDVDDGDLDDDDVDDSEVGWEERVVGGVTTIAAASSVAPKPHNQKQTILLRRIHFNCWVLP